MHLKLLLVRLPLPPPHLPPQHQQRYVQPHLTSGTPPVVGFRRHTRFGKPQSLRQNSRNVATCSTFRLVTLPFLACTSRRGRPSNQVVPLLQVLIYPGHLRSARVRAAFPFPTRCGRGFLGLLIPQLPPILGGRWALHLHLIRPTKTSLWPWGVFRTPPTRERWSVEPKLLSRRVFDLASY